MNYNKAIIGGHLTRDPELRQLSSGTAACAFGIATNRRRKDRDDEVLFIDCNSYGKTAELINEHFKKGDPILVEGYLRLEQWQDRETGANRSKISLTVNEMVFVGGRREQGQTPATAVAAPQPSAAIAEPPPIADDDIPF